MLDTESLVNYYSGDSEDDAEQAKTSGRTLASQMSRFIKYYQDKGFEIILPELDMTKVPKRNLDYNVEEVLALPSMTVVYDSVDKNQIMATRLDLSKDLKKWVTESGLIGGYDSSPAPNVGEAAHYNIRCLVNEVYDSFKHVARGERWDHVFDFVPLLTPRMVLKSFETVMEDLESGSIPVDTVAGDFSVTSPSEVIDKLMAQPLRESICRKGILPREFTVDHDDLKELAEKEISSLLDLIEGLRHTLQRKGLHRLITPFPESVSTVHEVYNAIYGPSGIKSGTKD